MRNRNRQRELRRQQREECLDRRNAEGYLDLTPFIAVEAIRREEKSSLKKVRKGAVV